MSRSTTLVVTLSSGKGQSIWVSLQQMKPSNPLHVFIPPGARANPITAPTPATRVTLPSMLRLTVSVNTGGTMLELTGFLATILRWGPNQAQDGTQAAAAPRTN